MSEGRDAIRVIKMTENTSRRDAIKVGLAALAGMGLTALAPKEAFAAAGGNFILGVANDSGTSQTSLTSASTGYTLSLTNTVSGGSVLYGQQVGGNSHAAMLTHSGAGQTLRVSQTGTGTPVYAYTSGASNDSPAINGYAVGSNATGVLGECTSTFPNGRGAKGSLTAATAQGCALEGFTNGSGGATGVWGNVGPNGTGPAVKGTNAGTGEALRAEITSAVSNATAVRVTHTGLGAGLTVETSNVDNGGGAVQIAHAGTNQAVFANSTNTGATQPTIVANSVSTELGARGVAGNLTNNWARGYGVEGSTVGTGGGGVLAKASAPGTALALHAVSTGLGSAGRVQISNSSNTQPALIAVTSGTGCAIQAEGGRAQLYLKPAATAGPPASGSHLLGEVFMDASGTLHTCVAAGAPGTWMPLAVNSGGAAAIHDGANTAALTVTSPSPSRPAIVARASASNGAALRVEGKMSMTRSGKVKISKGKSSKTVTVPGGIATSAIILCTLQNSGGSGVYIKYAKRVSSTQFKIYLGKSSAYTLYVGWMVLG